MGGNAIKTVPISRIPTRNAFFRLTKRICDMLPAVRIPPPLPDKTSFGDIDVIFPIDVYIHVKELVVRHFRGKYHDIVKNGNVWSFAWWIAADDEANEHGDGKGRFYQVDFISCKFEEIEMYNFYFSYGDKSHILGMMCYMYGLSYGQDGLYLLITADLLAQVDSEFNPPHLDRSKKKLLNCPRQICEFLGLDYDAHASFRSNEDVSRWLMSAKVADRIALHKLQRKRGFQSEFLDFYAENFVKRDDQQQMPSTLEIIHQFGLEDELRRAIASIQKSNERKAKFNGHMLQQLGYSGAHLGCLVRDFKQAYAPFDEFLDSHTADEIMSEFLEWKRKGFTK